MDGFDFDVGPLESAATERAQSKLGVAGDDNLAQRCGAGFVPVNGPSCASKRNA
jgi:hypothetical protein